MATSWMIGSLILEELAQSTPFGGNPSCGAKDLSTSILSPISLFWELLFGAGCSPYLWSAEHLPTEQASEPAEMYN